MTSADALLSIAVDLTSSLGSDDRYRRLLQAVRRAIPADAAALLMVDGDALVPLAVHGLSQEVVGRRFPLAEHPRLDVVSRSQGPVVFPADSALADPFDGLVDDVPDALAHIHACLGCPLRVNDRLVGVLTADALDPGAFDGIDLRELQALGALAAAAVRTNRLIEALEDSARRHGLIASEVQRDARERQGELIGTSSAMEGVRREIELVARSGLPVLITGETGVGKELVARAIHANSARAAEPMIHLNCAALPDSIAESELFGHLRGAFTGADRDRPGKFEIADRGTLMLDEVGELAPALQAKLLRALQEGEIQRVGADRPMHVDVRVVAATNRELPAEVASGRFRADLFHRLSVYPLHVPPLRERGSDVLLLAGHFCERARARIGLGPVRLTLEAREALSAYHWPGNVRELESVIWRAVLRASAAAQRDAPVPITPDHLGRDFSGARADSLPPEAADSGVPAASLRARVAAFRRRAIEQAVRAEGGNLAAAARRLGMDRSNLHHAARKLGLLT